MRFKVLDYLVTLVVAVSGGALVLLVAITGWQVYGRYVLNDTPTWAERLSLLLILIVALPLSAVGLRENIHLGISYIVEMLPRRAQYGFELLRTLLLGAFGVAMSVYSYELVVGTWNRAIPLLGVPQGVQYLPLVITGGLIVIFMAERMWFLLRHPAEWLERTEETI
ncbi:TRAP transporter small permease [Tranquillimonas alkanivorans]|uniref:TRAP transporter small permease protein n=1 Tax=Tranquillimonas alkanivorans TaxID=441119 RepID=A0A1I5Q293_9RHOB|nr:TRAP transporter small permease [Tranquillimonas alkanivorans]SFP40345.1 TRAP-type C4-dicarboxylate transport system, small permease component [Tranquillimonas alkanivorans]